MREYSNRAGFTVHWLHFDTINDSNSAYVIDCIHCFQICGKFHYRHTLILLLYMTLCYNLPTGDELADLVDCRNGVVLQQLPCRVFWSGFCKVSCKLFLYKTVRIHKLVLYNVQWIPLFWTPMGHDQVLWLMRSPRFRRGLEGFHCITKYMECPSYLFTLVLIKHWVLISMGCLIAYLQCSKSNHAQ